MLHVLRSSGFGGVFVGSWAPGGGDLRRDLGTAGLRVPVTLFDRSEALPGIGAAARVSKRTGDSIAAPPWTNASARPQPP